MSRGNAPVLRHFTAALLRCLRAAVGKGTARRGINELGRRAVDGVEPPLTHLVEAGRGLLQSPRVRVLGLIEYLVCRAGLDDAAGIHDDDALGKARDHAHIVRDEQHCRLLPLLHLPDELKDLRLTRPRFDFRALGKACYNGSSEMVSNLSTSLVGVLYNIQLMAIAQENGVSAYGVIMYVSFIFMAFFFGYSIAVTPVVGYHYGAENHAELKSLLKKSLTITLISSLVMTVSSIALASPIARIFVGYDAELCEMTVNALRLYALSFLVCGFNIFGSAFFTGLNNGTASALISFLRTLVLQVAAVLLLPRVLGIDGIWLAITAAEALTLLVTAALFLAGRRKHHYV